MDLPDKEFICKGQVDKKWEEGGERLALLTVWTENEAGVQTTGACP
ncbi:MAG: hypothetical protein NTV89_07590 [Proteobacteria bacterium]|nr:hypothetical protein [Pseudomonadota bacterium]